MNCWQRVTRAWGLVRRPRARFLRFARRFVPLPLKMRHRWLTWPVWRWTAAPAVRPSAANTRRFTRYAGIARRLALHAPFSAGKLLPEALLKNVYNAPREERSALYGRPPCTIDRSEWASGRAGRSPFVRGLEVKAQLRRVAPRGHIVRSAEGGEEII